MTLNRNEEMKATIKVVLKMLLFTTEIEIGLANTVQMLFNYYISCLSFV